MDRINLAFIGSGNWARKYHFPALAWLGEREPGLVLRGIHSLDAATAQSVADEYGFQQVYANLDDLLADETVNAYAVAVSPAALPQVMARLMTRPLPVFSEKPPGISAADAESLARLVTVPNVVAFNRRFIPLNNRFKALVDETPDIYFVEAHFFRHNRQDTDFVVETSIHWINYAEYLFGPIADVQTETFPHPTNDTQVRVVRLTFASGLRGLLKIFPCTGAQGERMEVHSPSRALFLEGPLWADPGRIVIEENDGHPVLHLQKIVRREIAGNADGPEVVERGIVGEYQEFFAAVHTGVATRSNFQNAVNTMRVAEMIEKG